MLLSMISTSVKMTPLADLTSDLNGDFDAPSKVQRSNGCRSSPTGDKPTCLTFDDTVIASNHLIQLNTLRRSGEFCDVCLSVRGRHILGHRVVLAGSSVYLYELFSNALTSSAPLTTGPLPGHHTSINFNIDIEDPNIDADSLEILVNYIYTARLVVESEMVKSVYRTASCLKIQSAADACSTFLADNLSPTNCLGIRTFADGNRDLTLTLTTDAYIAIHLTDVLQSPERCTLPNVQIRIVGVPKTELRVDESIAHLANLVVNWIKGEYSTLVDEDEFSDQLHMVYLTPDRNLKDCRLMKERYTDTSEIKDYRTQMRQLHRYEPGRQSRSSSTERREWKLIAFDMWSETSCICVAMLAGNLSIISLSLQAIDSGIPSIDETDVEESISSSDQYSLAPLASMQSARCGVGIVTLSDDSIVVMGGYNRGECLDSVEAYNTSTNTWSPLPKLPHPRGRFCATVIADKDGADKIYICGGSNGQSDLDTCMKYDVEKEEWSEICSMSMARSCPAVTSLNGKLYAIGGWNGYNGVNSCEVYNSDLDTWSPIAPMHHARSQCTACVFSGQIVVMGGCDAWDCTNSVETYCPVNDQWSLLPPMGTARRGAGSAVFKGNLYVVGGSDGHQCLSSVEVYNSSSLCWTAAASLTTPRCNVGVASSGGSSHSHSAMYAVGGFSGRHFLADAECMNPISTTSNTTCADLAACTPCIGGVVGAGPVAGGGAWCTSVGRGDKHDNSDSGHSDSGDSPLMMAATVPGAGAGTGTGRRGEGEVGDTATAAAMFPLSTAVADPRNASEHPTSTTTEAPITNGHSTCCS